MGAEAFDAPPRCRSARTGRLRWLIAQHDPRCVRTRNHGEYLDNIEHRDNHGPRPEATDVCAQAEDDIERTDLVDNDESASSCPRAKSPGRYAYEIDLLGSCPDDDSRRPKRGRSAEPRSQS